MHPPLLSQVYFVMTPPICLGSPGNQNVLTTIPTKELLLDHNAYINDNNVGQWRTVSLETFSTALERCLDWKGKDSSSVEPNEHPVSLYDNLDGHLLRCLKAMTDDDEDGNEDEMCTILGVRENQSLFSGKRIKDLSSNSEVKTPWKQERDLKIRFQVFQPTVDNDSNVAQQIHGSRSYDVRSNHPKRDWTRRPIRFPLASMNGTTNNSNTVDGQVTLFDLASLQSQRRQNTIDFNIDTPGYVCHLLRSILTLQVNETDDDGTPAAFDPHFVSPWSTNNHNIDTKTDYVFGILLRNQLEQGTTACDDNGSSSKWDVLEKRELVELMKFRTGDACPSFYLHSASQLESNFDLESFVHVVDKRMNNSQGTSRNLNDNGRIEEGDGYTLLIYRTLPPRDQFKDESNDNDILALPPGCLLEEFVPPGKTKDAENTQYRIVAPPYQSHQDTYGDLLKDIFMNPKNLELLTNEVKRIPQWTAWPERNHYQSDYDKDDNNSDGPYPASWTVFPLVYCFPASDVTARQWISKTCAFVPHTTSLLRKLGPTLRTALFSRLDPRTTLGSHTGWADLANHVLRVHIPLIVPSGQANDGLCGTWVDGCVETHEEGRIVCFDDSKTHRAFNYSDEERIVLIIDLERPTDLSFPGGTASGGHTNELDAFIKQFS